MVKGQSEIWCATYDYSQSANVGNNKEENVVDCMAYYTEMKQKNDLTISANRMIFFVANTIQTAKIAAICVEITIWLHRNQISPTISIRKWEIHNMISTVYPSFSAALIEMLRKCDIKKNVNKV